ncbi:heavy metal translocating P-type ATPase [Xanthobacter autotrophicus]|uniref:heavy metal translocating P-type ATPase n=1 Tax=Xanthobacter autotrophicus TaxID=280 RepID=UPI0024A6D571|nr:heavy metal translocating P-type ATPase [Xanthobacter autotrophicus]MDI4657452.1 cadmium-translocating P-type ATPase [Xanthobacter autotrophicus]
MTAPLVQSRFRVTGMDCASCAAKIEGTTLRIAGVAEAEVSVAAGTLVIRHAQDADLAPLAGRLSPMGYALAPLASDSGQRKAHDHGESCAGHDHAGHDHDHSGHDHAEAGDHDQGAAPAAEGSWWSTGKARLTLLSGLALVAAFGIGTFVPAVQSWLYLAAMLVGLVPIARRAIAAAANGMPFTIEMLMTIAAAGAVIIGAAEEAAAVVFLFLVGELLEGVAAGRARASIRALTALVPKTALVERDGATVEIPAASLMVGDVILVRPGDRISADGVIVAGESGIDESPVTGESVPVRKGPQATVFAGTVNEEAALRVRVTATAEDNTIARVVKLVEEAQEKRAPTERLIDRFSRYYTPGVVVVAALVAVIPPLLFGGGWDAWIYKGLAILLIGCPCALVISTPAAIAAGLSAGARCGLLLKGGAVLETAGKVTTVCFDKTGTLTQGRPQVTDVIAFAQPAAEVLRLAAALETGSSHPLAKAILDRAAADAIAIAPAEAAQALGGKGVSAQVEGREVFLGSPQAAAARAPLTQAQADQIATLNDAGKTVSLLVADGAIAGAIAMRDEPRPDAAEGLAALKRESIRTVMLTGDNRRTAEAIGRQLGIEVRAELLPQDKLRIVGELQREGAVVAKVGDGINDAPALAAADIGIAMGGGTDVALETADAAALHGRVKDISSMIALSRRTMGNIHQNIAISLGLKAVFLVTTIAGITGLWPAILADTGATVLVTLNALRLLSFRPQ